jgi:hypothetical protein
MALAHVAAYSQILAHIGPVALAVTSSLNMTFLRKPERADMRAEATFLKLERKLAVVDVRIRSEGSRRPGRPSGRHVRDPSCPVIPMPHGHIAQSGRREGEMPSLRG